MWLSRYILNWFKYNHMMSNYNIVFFLVDFAREFNVLVQRESVSTAWKLNLMRKHENRCIDQ